MSKKFVHCTRCGNWTTNFQKICSPCLIEMKQPERIDHDELDPLRELPEDEYCVTCGREWGTELRKDGRYYCSMCWTVWNS